MKFCSQCGRTVSLIIPEGDILPRHVCQHCGTIHYLNPKLVVGCIAEWQDQILLCRRSIAPRYGLWTLPAGFMENGETTTQAAIRETLEEACARVDIRQLFSLINVPHINQVHLFYRARLLDIGFSAGLETLETALFSEVAIPWQDLAFQSVTLCLKAYFSDRSAGRFVFHEETLQPHQDWHRVSDHPKG
ncbi:MAG: NUDIX hydrolase [Candidatus Accumulibacter sp.]|uniref:NUDIX hydrolase n=1 Tax=Accumulibacter sp. TaxID=2053492 RepID=UPI00258B2391|nr:NUDIX hydrolase [Accumulibacter sp.]MCM8622115.1 NUDIX hydrolase [Accumulibacter sp.]